MKSLVFDTGPIITFALNNLFWLFKELKRQYKGTFFITPAIRKELIEKPLTTKKFKYEAHQVALLLKSGVLRMFVDTEMKKNADEISELANNTFLAHNHPITIVHEGEMEAVACALINRSDAVVVDERTTRYLIEEPRNIYRILEKKLHTKIDINKNNLERIKARLEGVKVVRSVELITVAYEMELLDKYIMQGLKDPRRELLDGLLWGMKLNGCAVTEEEIHIIEKKVL